MSMKLPPRVTMDEASAVHQRVQAAVAQHADSGLFCVDAGELVAFDTSALAVLLAAHRAAKAKGQGFSIEHPPVKLNQLAALYGISALLGLQTAGI
jgi:ABC-type transporter Mla MlaB component